VGIKNDAPLELKYDAPASFRVFPNTFVSNLSVPTIFTERLSVPTIFADMLVCLSTLFVDALDDLDYLDFYLELIPVLGLFPFLGLTATPSFCADVLKPSPRLPKLAPAPEFVARTCWPLTAIPELRTIVGPTIASFESSRTILSPCYNNL
jgi:hypothetical protein